MGKGKKNVKQRALLSNREAKDTLSGPFSRAEEACETFASGMLTSYYLYSLCEMLDEAEREGMMDSLEVRLSLQIVFDTMLGDVELPN